MTRGKLANLWMSTTLSGALSYFDYELAVGRDILVPWLKTKMRFHNLTVGDFGCHQGGILQALRETGEVVAGNGYDLNQAAIQTSPFVGDEHFQIQVGDVTQLDAAHPRFNLILIRDVLEHIPDYATVVEKAFACLQPGGLLFVSFPPYYSPFGGHQQLASNAAKLLPYIHYLPEGLFNTLVQTEDSTYMTALSAQEDMQSVRQTRLTLSKAEQAFQQAGFQMAGAEYFLSRPEFKVRYGIPALSAGPLGRLWGLRELYVMGVYYLLRKPERAAC